MKAHREVSLPITLRIWCCWKELNFSWYDPKYSSLCPACISPELHKTAVRAGISTRTPDINREWTWREKGCGREQLGNGYLVEDKIVCKNLAMWSRNHAAGVRDGMSMWVRYLWKWTVIEVLPHYLKISLTACNLSPKQNWMQMR